LLFCFFWPFTLEEKETLRDVSSCKQLRPPNFHETLNNSPAWICSPFCHGIEKPEFIDSNPGIYCTVTTPYSPYLGHDPVMQVQKFNFHSSKTSSTRGARFLRLGLRYYLRSSRPCCSLAGEAGRALGSVPYCRHRLTTIWTSFRLFLLIPDPHGLEGVPEADWWSVSRYRRRKNWREREEEGRGCKRCVIIERATDHLRTGWGTEARERVEQWRLCPR